MTIQQRRHRRVVAFDSAVAWVFLVIALRLFYATQDLLILMVLLAGVFIGHTLKQLRDYFR